MTNRPDWYPKDRPLTYHETIRFNKWKATQPAPMTVPASYLWRTAQAAEPILWDRLVSGVYDEEKTSELISASLERAANRIKMLIR